MKLGLNPTHLDEFIQIKEQINFLHRPGKSPDWKRIQHNAETLLNVNGIDLQTLVYLTVAHHQLKNDVKLISLDIEKIAISLVSYWDNLWPQDIQARVGILNWLNRQIGDSIRTHLTRETKINDVFRLSNSLSLIVNTLSNHTEQTCHLSYLLISVNEYLEPLASQTSTCEASTGLEKTAYHQLPKQKMLHSPNVIVEQSAPDQQTTTSLGIDKMRIDSQSTDNSAVIQKALPKLNRLETVNMPPNAEKNDRAKSTFSFFRLFWGYLFAFLLGGIVTYCGKVYLFPKPHMDVELTRFLSSPLYPFYYGESLLNQNNSLMSDENKHLSTIWRTKMNEYAQAGETFVKPSQVKANIEKLQQDLLHAESTKQGLTISYLKTALYGIEREMNQRESLEQLLNTYYQEPHDIELKQKIDRRFLSLLAYYYHLQGSDNTPHNEQKSGR